MRLIQKVQDYGRLIRFSHTIFALPFAFASVALASARHPISLRSLFWILVAMIAARSAAMGFNRLVDRKFDALNPRTKAWEIPQGKVKVSEAAVLTAAASMVFIYAAYQLNFLCFVLSPAGLAIVFFYSLTKRFTWTSHLFLGLALSIAPLGSWLAISGPPSSFQELSIPCLLGLAVIFWLAGFDIIYALQDRDFDRAIGLYSIPARFGVVRALRLSRFFHALTVLFLATVGVAAKMGIIYWLGCAAVSAVLFWEHRIVRPDDLSRINRAFFDLNAYVSIAYFLTTAGDILLNAQLGFGR
jgi:4-hydroxybenzoate polyprenyltransferase